MSRGVHLEGSHRTCIAVRMEAGRGEKGGAVKLALFDT